MNCTSQWFAIEHLPQGSTRKIILQGTDFIFVISPVYHILRYSIRDSLYALALTCGMHSSFQDVTLLLGSFIRADVAEPVEFRVHSGWARVGHWPLLKRENQQGLLLVSSPQAKSKKCCSSALKPIPGSYWGCYQSPTCSDWNNSIPWACGEVVPTKRD